MKTVSILLVSCVLCLTVLVDPAPAQLAPAGRSVLNLTGTAVEGSTAIGAHLSYKLNDSWDFLVAYDTVSAAGGSASLFGVGARYHLTSATPNSDPYFAVAYLSANVVGAGTGSGYIIGGGTSLSFDTNFTGFGTVGLVSGAGGSTTGYDIGLQYRAAQQFSIVMGYSNVWYSQGGWYFGVGFGLPGR